MFVFFLGGVGLGVGGQGRCEQRSEVFVKIQNKKKKLRGGGGVVLVNEELKFFVKIQNIFFFFFFFFGGGGSGRGVRLDVNKILKFM